VTDSTLGVYGGVYTTSLLFRLAASAHTCIICFGGRCNVYLGADMRRLKNLTDCVTAKGALYYTAASSGICSRSSLRIQVRRDHVNRPSSRPLSACPPLGSIPNTTLSHARIRPSVHHGCSIDHSSQGRRFSFFASLCLQLCLMGRRFCVLTLTGLIGSDSLSRLANSAFADHSDETLHPIFLHQRFAWPVATTAPCLPFSIAIGLHFCG